MKHTVVPRTPFSLLLLQFHLWGVCYWRLATCQRQWSRKWWLSAWSPHLKMYFSKYQIGFFIANCHSWNHPGKTFPFFLADLSSCSSRLWSNPTALIFPLKFANDISKTSHTREYQQRHLTKLTTISCCSILLSLWSISAQILVVSIKGHY